MTEENKNIPENEGNEGQETLQQNLGNSIEFLEKNKSLINKILIGIILVMGVYFAKKKMIDEPNEQQAREDLFRTEYLFQKDSFAQAEAAFQDIVDENGSTSAGEIAHLYLGISLMQQSKFEEAIEALEEFEGQGYFMPAIGTGLLADCYSETNQIDDAVSSYKKAAKQADSKVTSSIFLKKAGLLLEQNEQPEKAAKLYQKILDKYYYEDIREFQQERNEIVTYLKRASLAAK